MMRWISALVFVWCFTATATFAQATKAFTLEQVGAFSFPDAVAAAAKGSRIAWSMEIDGRRNVWVAEGPSFTPRQLTRYAADDGQELTSLQLSEDGSYVVYVRGGDHGGNWDRGVPVNASSGTQAPKLEVWSVLFTGGDPVLLGEGDYPVISPRGDRVAFVKAGVVMIAPLAGGEAKRLFYARGSANDLAWSPEGDRLAFSVNRSDHSIIGVFKDDATPILWLAPSITRDSSPSWSPDGKRIAFVRQPGKGGEPDLLLEFPLQPWAIWAADTSSGQAKEIWRSTRTPRGSLPSTDGGANLHWAAQGRVVFVSYEDGWPHLYSVSENGGAALLLTAGNYMVENVALTADSRHVIFSGNLGSDPDDIDRRHIGMVPVDRAEVKVVTPGTGLEWFPAVTGDGKHVAYIGATAQRPPTVTIRSLTGGEAQLLKPSAMASAFPESSLVTPKPVQFTAEDGVPVRGQLFLPPEGKANRGALIYLHGGPQRQMLLGWHMFDYYSRAYALNQYLASRGFVVLSVNYRLGIGYGYDLHKPAQAGYRGASETKDVTASAMYLRSLAGVDASRIGVFGGSYGGFLTAMALAHRSDLFAAGVDVHGVHNWGVRSQFDELFNLRQEKPADYAEGLEVMWRSSPVSAVATWKSPALFIHGDDDRNVPFNQTIDLVNRLERRGVKLETLVVPDDTHHLMKHENWLNVAKATAEYLERTLITAPTKAP